MRGCRRGLMGVGVVEMVVVGEVVLWCGGDGYG